MRILFILPIVAVATLALVQVASATPGDLDPTFGTGGKVLTAFAEPTNTHNYATAHAVALQADGKIIVVGHLVRQEGPPFFNAYVDFALARYNPDGSLDPGFGSGGKVTTDFDGHWDEAYAVAVQSDGKIVVAGTSTGDFALARYNTDGSLDAGFNSGGKVRIDYDYRFEGSSAYAVGILDVNNAVVAGDRANSVYPQSSFMYADYDLYYGGSLNGHFGDAGVVQRYIAPDWRIFWYNAVWAIAVKAGGAGSFISAGITKADDDSAAYFAIASYDHYGLPDQTFGDHGSPVLTDFGTKAGARAVAIQPDGKIVAVGGWTGTEALARYNTNGSLDTNFGSGGKIVTNAGEARGVAVQPDGKIIVGGGWGGDFVLFRRNPDGSLDPTFGVGGKAVTGLMAALEAITLQPDGKIIAVGSSGGGFALARYIVSSSLTLMNPNYNGANFSASFQSENAVTYRIQYKNNLNDPSWTTLTTITGDGTVQSFTDPAPAATGRFYRIEVP
jgi:uncharacterized delta-60 repeat protein